MSDISCANKSAKKLSLVDGLTTFSISADVITSGVTRSRSGNVSDALFINSCLDYNNTNYAARRQLSNGKTFINSYGVYLQC